MLKNATNRNYPPEIGHFSQINTISNQKYILWGAISQPNPIITPIAEISFDPEKSLLNVRVLEGAEMNLENAKEHYRLIHELVGSKKYLALVDTTHYYPIHKDAWQYASQLEISANRLAAAQFSTNLPNKIALNFFKSTFNSSVPVELFDSREEAIAWLEKFRGELNSPKNGDYSTC